MSDLIFKYKKGQRLLLINNEGIPCFLKGDTVRLLKQVKEFSRPAWVCRTWFFGIRQIVFEHQLYEQ